MTADTFPALASAKASQSRGARPEDILANAERATGRSLAGFLELIPRHVPPIHESELRDHTDRARQYHEGRLANFPAATEIARLAEAARKGLAVQTPAIIAREVATLVAAFPSAALPAPEIYIATAVYDLLDLGIPDAVAVLACRKIRRTQRFAPTISEICTTAQALLEDWQTVATLPDKAEAARRQLSENLANLEAEAERQALERQRRAENAPREMLWRDGAKPNPERARAVCCFPSLTRAWRDDAEMLRLLGRADFETQQQTSGLMAQAKKGETAARAFLRRKLGAEL